ncbi:peptide deformylase [Candidatus Pacearchaeota archaeon]|nr:peptide deformylase [Candidatus Pacearchaeota archaeon]
MAVKDIITDEAMLRKDSWDIETSEMAEVVTDLIDTAEHHRNAKIPCAGLAANQIGYNRKVFVIKNDNKFEPIINPEIIARAGGIKAGMEACLSRPDKGRIKMRRHKRVLVEYYEQERNIWVRRWFEGFYARVVQHEMDHFEGRLI